MKSISQKTELDAKIAFLKIKQEEDFIALKNQYNSTIASLNPLNMIKTAAINIISEPGLKSNLINGAIGLGVNYLSKNVVNEYSTNPVKRILSKVFKIAVKVLTGKNLKKI